MASCLVRLSPDRAVPARALAGIVLRYVLGQDKLEREQQFDEAGAGASSSFCSRSSLCAVRMRARRTGEHATLCYAGYFYMAD